MVDFTADGDLFFIRRNPDGAAVTPHSKLGVFDIRLFYPHQWLPTSVTAVGSF
jgi:hypothetical protein